MKILLGVTGSVATILAEKLINSLETDHEVMVVQTYSSRRILNLSAGSGSKYQIVTEEQEWSWKRKGDPIYHIRLRDWMDMMNIAPLSANTLGKMANGLCDNLLLSIWLAAGNKPIIVAPAMNTQMWKHPIVIANTNKLANIGIRIIEPVKKTLACGETGIGAMAHADTIVEIVRKVACVP